MNNVIWKAHPHPNALTKLYYRPAQAPGTLTIPQHGEPNSRMQSTWDEKKKRKLKKRSRKNRRGF